MDDKALEERLARIEKMLVKLDQMLVRSCENLDVADLKLELRVSRIEVAIGELAEVERLAERAYLKTHPEAHSEVEAAKDFVEIAAYIESLPSSIDRNRESKS